MDSPVPIFPLPNVVLFPHMLLPLHIFEPRYRSMVRDVLSGGGPIVMALLRPGWETQYEGRPPIFPVGGLGRILHHTELPDGRFHVMLVGETRVRLTEIPCETEYRQGRIDVLEDRLEEARAEEREPKRKALIQAHSGVLQTLLGRDYAEVPLAVLCDLLASVLVRDPHERQGLLECLDVDERHDRLARMLDRPFPTAQQPSMN